MDPYVSLVVFAFLLGLFFRSLHDRWGYGGSMRRAAKEERRKKAIMAIHTKMIDAWMIRAKRLGHYDEKCNWYIDGHYLHWERGQAMAREGDPYPSLQLAIDQYEAERL